MSAIAKIDLENSQIVVSAKLILYGKYAEQELGLKIVAEIDQMWNEPRAFLKIGTTELQVVFETNFECVENKEAFLLSQKNESFEVNYIRIEDKNVAERSMMGYSLGENSGHWIITDNLGESTTAAHEFGHAYGLPHPNLFDYRNTGLPPIMAPRGTIVDADFQWNPLAEPGAPGGTMKPIFRRVRQSEVLDIFANAVFDNNGHYNIGKITNMIFDEIGQPIGSLI